ncbi:aldo/keto reductase [Haloglomus halophilum]|uniref:aldo/keto reductase n=1 Tax=Haloglomus halophilum TaxID=2962672 RepID=UPI0020C9B16E|nr:aldo/keto reductase [Haloglomus halophilum]
MVTKEASWAYRDGVDEEFARTYFRRFGPGVVSSVGVGTYLGDPTDEQDERYETAVRQAVESGVSVVDTAVNYRAQRSERAVGRAIEAADVDREALLVATKGGFVPFDGAQPDDPAAYVREEWFEPDHASPGEMVRGNCLSPRFLSRSLDLSLENLGLDTVDLYYVHNPETQLAERDRETVYDLLEDAFVRLEERREAGDLRYYGVATWECFRVPQDHPNYLSLPEVVRRARAASDRADTNATGFRAVQLPFNVHMADAFTRAAHDGPEGPQSALAFAHEAGLDVFASAPLKQGALAREGAIPDDVAAKLAGETPAQRAINFARSAPGVTAALVGTGSPEHVAENVGAGRYEPLGADAFDATFE